MYSLPHIIFSPLTVNNIFLHVLIWLLEPSCLCIHERISQIKNLGRVSHDVDADYLNYKSETTMSHNLLN